MGQVHRMKTLPAALALGFLILVSVLAMRCAGESPREATGAPPRHVLLITLDTTRADRLGCYGYQQARTPVLDGLARQGVLFEAAYAPAVITLPSHASILTGLLPPAHGLRENSGQRLGPGTPTLATALQEAGYRTGAVIGAFVLDSMYGLDRGFQTYDDSIPEPGTRGRRFPERSAAEVTDAALAWLAGSGSEPWFLWVHYYDPHSPFTPPSPYSEQHPGEPYDGEISYMDAEIGRLLGALAGRELDRETVVIAAGDHGEGLEDHGEQGHGIFLYDETARVPLIVRVPGLAEPQRVPAVVRLTDLAPTILEALGLPPLPGAEGRSLWPLMRGRGGEERAAYTEATSPLFMYGWSPLASLRVGAWKYIQAPTPELYDLAADPGERTNLLARQRERAGRMKERLEEVHRSSLAAGGGTDQVQVTSEEMEKLRSLGYVGGGGPTGTPAITDDPLVLLEGGARGLADPKARVGQLRRITEIYSAFRTGDFPRAAETARSLLDEDPGNRNVRQFLGDALMAMQRHEEALAEYRTLVTSDPRNVEYLLRAGLTLIELGRLDEARETLEVATSLEPEHLRAAGALCAVHAQRGEDDLALACHRGIVEKHPRHRNSLLAIARIHEKHGRHPQARETYRRAADLDPGDILPRLSLASIQAADGDYEEALATLDEAARADPTMADLDLFRADIHLEMGRLDGAERLYRAALAKAPREPLGYHGLGRIAAARGDRAGAARYFRQALQVSPTFTPAREALARLGR